MSIQLELPQDWGVWLAPDKIEHCGAFGLLVWLAFRAFRFALVNSSDGRIMWASIATSSSLGALLELWQMFFPYRSAELADWVADTLGALVAGGVAIIWIKWRKRHVMLHE